MATIDLTNYYDFFPEVYYPYLDNKCRFLLLYGGNGSGKSWFAAYKVIYRLLTEKNIVYCIVRDTYESLKDSCYALLKKLVIILGLESIFEFTISPLKIKCSNGSSVIFKGCDKIEKIKSIQADSYWLEETDQIGFFDFDEINTRLRSQNYYNQIIMTFNPVSRFSWIKKWFFDKEQSNTTIVKTTYKDNPLLPASNVQQILEKINISENAWRVSGLGEWGYNEEGLVFTHIKFGKPERVKRTFYGIDFGYTAPTALIRIDVDFDENYYMHEEIYRTGLVTSEIISLMNDLKISKSYYVWADCAEPDRVKEIKRAGYNIRPIKKGAGSVMNGINIMKNTKLYTHSGNINLNNELENYSYINKDGQFLDEVERINDHGIDSVRGALIMENLKSKVFEPLKWR